MATTAFSPSTTDSDDVLTSGQETADSSSDGSSTTTSDESSDESGDMTLAPYSYEPSDIASENDSSDSSDSDPESDRLADSSW